MTTWRLSWRGGAPDSTCEEYAKYQHIADELVANIKESASIADYEQAQQSLLFLFQELTEQIDPLHPRFPGGHRCVKEAYLHSVMLLRNRALFHKPQSISPLVPHQPPLTPEQVVTNLKGVAEKLKRPRDTYLGRDNPLPPQEHTR